MTYWAARACARYGRDTAARQLIELALDATAAEFTRSGTLWEFYHPNLGEPAQLLRKPPAQKMPNRDYVGHNPLFAMAELWRRSGGKGRCETLNGNLRGPITSSSLAARPTR
jgi:hypothetical protein